MVTGQSGWSGPPAARHAEKESETGEDYVTALSLSLVEATVPEMQLKQTTVTTPSAKVDPKRLVDLCLES